MNDIFKYILDVFRKGDSQENIFKHISEEIMRITESKRIYLGRFIEKKMITLYSNIDYNIIDDIESEGEINMRLLFKEREIGILYLKEPKKKYDNEIFNKVREIADIISLFIIYLARCDVKDSEISKAKGLFMANMSHNIRSPLNGIIGATVLIADTSLNKQQAEYIDIMKQSSYSLMSIINDILDFNLLEAEKIRLEKDTFYLRECLELSYKIIKYKIKDKDIKLIYNIDSDVPACIVADSKRLKQVLVNLLTNAVKFTKEGSITTEIKAKKIKEAKSMDDMYLIEISVIDTGIGIRKSDISKLFRSFGQLNQSYTTNYKGTGLGLVICKQICKLMKGEIWVKSEYGKGSTFSFTFKCNELLDINKTLDRYIEIIKNKNVL
jgi:signal transduction histidine kinase